MGSEPVLHVSGLSPRFSDFVLHADRRGGDDWSVTERGFGSALASGILGGFLTAVFGAMVVQELRVPWVFDREMIWYCVLLGIGVLLSGYAIEELTTVRYASVAAGAQQIEVRIRSMGLSRVYRYAVGDCRVIVHRVLLAGGRGRPWQGWALVLHLPDQAMALCMCQTREELEHYDTTLPQQLKARLRGDGAVLVGWPFRLF